VNLKQLRATETSALALVLLAASPTFAQAPQKPNIVLIVSDDFGYGDSGPYGGGVRRGVGAPMLSHKSWSER
jgi:hypothetical protein